MTWGHFTRGRQATPGKQVGNTRDSGEYCDHVGHFGNLPDFSSSWSIAKKHFGKPRYEEIRVRNEK